MLSRTIERFVVEQYLYTAFFTLSPSLTLSDQYGSRPLQIVTNLLTCNSYVVVIALNFSKAFDTVRHSTLLHKMAQLDLPDTVGRHCLQLACQLLQRPPALHQVHTRSSAMSQIVLCGGTMRLWSSTSLMLRNTIIRMRATAATCARAKMAQQARRAD